MKSLRDLYRYGPGPSSSHTIAPYAASKRFASLIPEGEPVTVIFYGSLAHAFRGHHSDASVFLGLGERPISIYLDKETPPPHPLTMTFRCGEIEHTYFSLGGGALFSHSDPEVNEKEVYPFPDFSSFVDAYSRSSFSSVADYIAIFEPGIRDYCGEMLDAMFASIERGLSTSGEIPANKNPRLQVSRSAKDIFARAELTEKGQGRRELLLSAYGYAVVEGSACGEEVVTAPTCGSSGVLPAVLYYEYKNKGVERTRLVDAMLVAGIVGNVVKQNASIAGSVGGCQAEIGTATSMASAALSFIDGLSLHQIEYGAEVAMEHFLGLSCDPVDGYVVIPCIERNGVGAIRAYDSYLYAKYIEPIRKNQVSFDDVVKAMKMTGDSLDEKYKETALGGLASILKEPPSDED
ncbi:MAG: L-serine ammonia-lyase, iron-sulfur-dependent, subunit alpha [Bacilli bacterium]|nr:L-serine ammonia-lyase, iron-sulfur-dependent, subunit alpha [Bacilli bacterium]